MKTPESWVKGGSGDPHRETLDALLREMATYYFCAAMTLCADMSDEETAKKILKIRDGKLPWDGGPPLI